MLHVLWLSADVYASAMAVPVLAMILLAHHPPHRLHLAGQWAMAGGGLVVLLGRVIHSLPWPYSQYWPQWPWGTFIGIAVSGSLFAMVYWVGSAINNNPK
ncbi:MAG: hypothetical protein U0003_03805 [Vampirovibrionales bacterium]